MTIEEHIENLKAIASDIPSDKCSDWIESLMAGVKALEQQPCDDAVRRQAVLEVIKKCHCEEWVKADIGAPIEALSSVTPQPKMGRWIYRKEEDSYRCSLCNFHCHKDYMGAIPTDYCAGCGAKMSEVKG